MNVQLATWFVTELLIRRNLSSRDELDSAKFEFMDYIPYENDINKYRIQLFDLVILSKIFIVYAHNQYGYWSIGVFYESIKLDYSEFVRTVSEGLGNGEALRE